MNVAVVGSGYVGLVTGACLAEAGNHVVCIDRDQSKIDALRCGEIPIYEPGLKELVDANAAAGRMAFETDTAAGIADADIVFVAVGTPGRRDGGADMRAVDAVAASVAEATTRPIVLVLKSTVPVGTNERVRRLTKDAKHRVTVVSNPEFLKEGAAIDDFMRPERIVVGVDEGAGEDRETRALVERLYHPFCLGGSKLMWMNPESAELTKYVANTMLAMRISFMNEVAQLAEAAGGNVHDIRRAVGADSRIGKKFLHAGAGYGGSCFPKDVVALAKAGEDLNVPMELSAATHRVNERQKSVLSRKLKARFGGSLHGARIAVWGLAFKPGTDDIREAPALTTIDTLLSEGASVVAHDPEARDAVAALMGDRIKLVDDPYAAAAGADALILHTEWRQYQSPDFARLKREMKRALLLDGRNIWSAYNLEADGFEYEGIGL